MKHPLWMINSALLLLLTIALIFILFSRPSLLERNELVAPVMPPRPQGAINGNPKIIYEHDLFGTFYREVSPIEKETEEEMPPAPARVPVHIPPVATPQFLEPLPITLTGIMVTDHPDEGTAIILNTRTQEEKGFNVGDKFEDAQVVKIFSNKVVVIRSNGQQEMLYLRQEDAYTDAPWIEHGYWDAAIKQVTGDFFVVDPTEFVRRVKNLGRLIESLDLTMAYQEGQVVGCRIGDLDDHSFGRILGLKKGDIIQTIAQIPATSTTNNEKIYNYVVSLKKESVIKVTLSRNGQQIDLRIKVADIDMQAKNEFEVATGIATKSEQELEQERLDIMRQKHRFAPTAHELHKREQNNMWQLSAKNAQAPRLQTRNAVSNGV